MQLLFETFRSYTIIQNYFAIREILIQIIKKREEPRFLGLL
jgi:hypothetical protein